jgi:hypothetical protein
MASSVGLFVMFVTALAHSGSMTDRRHIKETSAMRIALIDINARL